MDSRRPEVTPDLPEVRPEVPVRPRLRLVVEAVRVLNAPAQGGGEAIPTTTTTHAPRGHR